MKLVNILYVPFLLFIILPKPILVFIVVKQKNISKSEQIISLLKQLHLCLLYYASIGPYTRIIFHYSTTGGR